MIKIIEIEDYLLNYKDFPLIDVRSPEEFNKGHIPTAVNIPLFSNEERAKVGTVYKQVSKEKAIELGYKFVTPKLEWYIAESQKIAKNNSVAVHCWRGGMRSLSFANHLHINGFKEVLVIKGGYKTFRNAALNIYSEKNDIRIIGGFTGSGKTYILNQLQLFGEQVINLEKIANHKGSSFGGIGQGEQTTIEQFENNLFWEWKDLDQNKPIWLEDESHRIGAVNIPMTLFEIMRKKNVYFLNIPLSKRADFLVDEYACYDKKLLAAGILRISTRLGGQNVKRALELLEEDNFKEVIIITLFYYDKYYLKGLEKRRPETVFKIEAEDTDHKKNAQLILDFFNKN